MVVVGRVRGLFDPLTDRILRIAKGDPLKVMVGTGIITAIVSLSGDGTTTTLICCTALVPIFKRLKMRLMNLAVILILMNTILNLLPWSGPTAPRGRSRCSRSMTGVHGSSRRRRSR